VRDVSEVSEPVVVLAPYIIKKNTPIATKMSVSGNFLLTKSYNAIKNADIAESTAGRNVAWLLQDIRRLKKRQP